MDINLQGRRAVVCGSTRGIGRACAVELASLGAEIVLLARDPQALREAQASLPAEHGQRHDHTVADFANTANVRHAAETIARSGRPVHILINNTGGPPAGAATDAKEEEFLAAFGAHLLCNHALVQALAPGMKAEAYGRIINIISTSVKEPIVGLGVSNTVRGAVANWAKTLSVELGPFGVTVNNVLPGATETDRLSLLFKNKARKTGATEESVAQEMRDKIPARRFARPEETAAAVAFLASPAASYINGINLPVDGGRTGSL